MRNFFATYSAGRGSAETTASLLLFDTHISIGWQDEQGVHHAGKWPLKLIDARIERGSSSLLRHTVTGEELRVDGKDAAVLISAFQEEAAKPWYSRKNAGEKKRILLYVTGLLSFLVALYFLMVPWLAEKASSWVKPETEREIGDAVYSAMLAGAVEDTAASVVLNDFFAAMAVPGNYRIRIAVIKEETVNAFALPGGRIVVYSGLLKQVGSYPELAALLSHEFVHVNNRHATKSIFRKMGSGIFVSLIFGRMGTVTNILAGHADELKSLTYSRKLETEADTAGLQLLLDRKIDPGGFVRLFEHLQASVPASGAPEFLNSHPDTEKRIMLIKQLSKKSETAPRADLNTIFNQLKH